MSLIGRIKPGADTDVYRGEDRLIPADHPYCRRYGRIALTREGYRYETKYDRVTVYGKGIIFKGPYAVAKPHVEDWDESRLDIIGQNGNDGLHYPTS